MFIVNIIFLMYMLPNKTWMIYCKCIMHRSIMIFALGLGQAKVLKLEKIQTNCVLVWVQGWRSVGPKFPWIKHEWFHLSPFEWNVKSVKDSLLHLPWFWVKKLSISATGCWDPSWSTFKSLHKWDMHFPMPNDMGINVY